MFIVTKPVIAISLETFISKTVEHHPHTAIYSLKLYQQDQTILKTEGAKDWTFSSTSTVSHAKPAQSSSFSPEKIETNTLNNSLGKVLWNSGTELSFFNTFSQLNQDSRSIISNGQELKFGNNNFFENQFGVLASYPLLNNKNGELSQYNYNFSKITKETIAVQLMQDKKRFILSNINTYLNWVLINKLETLTIKRYKVAVSALSLLKDKYKSNLIDKVDILRQKDYIQNISQELLKIKATKKAIKQEISLNSNIYLSKLVSPEFDLNSPLTIDASITFDTTLDHAIFSHQLSSYNLEKEFFVNSRKSKLDLDVSYALVGADTNFSNSLELNKYSAYISLIFSKTLYNHSNQADIDLTQLKIEELNTMYETDKLRFNIEKQKVITELESFNKIVIVNETQIKLAKQTALEEEKLYDIGKGNLSFVLQAQENVHQSKIRLIRSLLEVHKLTYRYLSLTDQLLIVFNEENLN